MKTRILTIGIALFMFSHLAFSQSKDTTKAPKVTFKATTDIVSSYIWRGVPSSNTLTPNFQPTLALDAGGLEVGVWGSSDFAGSYKEVDPYISYTFKAFKATFTDYDWNFISSTGNPISYFDYKNKSTGHIFEGSIAFLGTEKFPLSIALNTMIYGADKKWDMDSSKFTTKQNYSTYIELGYTFKQFSVLLGVTPSDGYYGDGYGKVGGFSVCNIGISSSRNIKFSKDFEMPLKASLFVNPQSENIFFVLGITL